MGDNLSSATDYSSFREVWSLTPDATRQLKFDPGIVFVSGHTIQVYVVYSETESTIYDGVRLWGYLTSN